MCDICSSALLDDVNKKINWRPDRVIKWAGKRGLVIDKKQLVEHFKKHVDTSIVLKNKTKNTSSKKSNSSQQQEQKIAQPDISKEKRRQITPSQTQHDLNRHPADEQFLNEVIDRVFQNLVEGNFDLKLEYGFKAIELKQKIADNMNVENLLLDLLNEIRSQELGDTGRS